MKTWNTITDTNTLGDQLDLVNELSKNGQFVDETAR